MAIDGSQPCCGTAEWAVNDKRVERIWRREGLKVPQKQPKKGRLWLNDGSCIRLRPEYPNHVWSYVASAMMSAVRAASSSGVVGILRCVDRCWPRTRHAKRSDT